MRFISLRTKMIVAFVMLILLPILISSIYAYREFESILHDQIEASATERLHQLNLSIERRLKTLMDASSAIVLDEGLQRILKHPPETVRQTLDAVHETDKKYLEISSAIVSGDAYFTLIDNDNNLYTNWGRTSDSARLVQDSEWYRNTLKENGFMQWTLGHPSYINAVKQNLVTVSMVIRDSNLNRIGVLVISEPARNYTDLISQSGELPGLGMLVGHDYRLLSDEPEKAQAFYNKIGSQLTALESTISLPLDGDNLVVSTYLSPLTGWRIIQIVPHKGIFQSIDRIRNVVSVTLAASMILFAVIIVLFSSMLTRPLRKLRKLMRTVEKGDLNVSCEIRTRDEIGLFGRSFDLMLVRLRKQIKNEIVLERNKEQAKLEALQAQINPHFLHNTLNTIRWMSIMAGTRNITEMLLSLGHLLDMSIHRGQEEITLREEMENVRYFLTIQKYRFGDNVQVIEEIESAVMELAVPKLTLQPLVENVYRHASFENEKGEMRICASVTSDRMLILQVIDNGLLLNQERLQEVSESISPTPSTEKKDSFSGIGLQNIQERIRMMYGKPYGLRIERRQEEGLTCAVVLLPMRKAGEPIENRSH